MDKEITELVEKLREGEIGSAEFTGQLDEVAEKAASETRESTERDSSESDRIDKLARKATRL
jgi:hypothetical protein